MEKLIVHDRSDAPKDFTGIIERYKLSRVWVVNGEPHRIDGPAVEYMDGALHWWLNGEYMSEKEHYEKTAWTRTPVGKLLLNEHFKLEEE